MPRPFLRALAPSLVVLLTPLTVARAQWVAQSAPTDAELRGLSVVSPSVVWASGAHGTVLHTRDGGATWIRDSVPSASRLDFRAIAATSARTAHVLSIGDSSRIYRTTNGGRSWSLRFTSTRAGSFFDAIQFWDARHGIAMSDPVDGRFLLITTNDGGTTWTPVPAERVPPALAGEGAFAASGTCLVVRGRSDVWLVSGGAATARVYHSPDRGRTWSVVETPIRAGVASAGIFSIAFADALHGVVAGGDYQQPSLRGRNVATTSDGGRTWIAADSAQSPLGYRSAVAYWPNSNGRRVIAVGLTGTDTSSHGGRSWATTDTVAYNSVALIADGRRCVRGWAVGPRGRIGTVRRCE
jgi:photosystem II stability/assembly factor-like uncharacterized protein